MRTCNWSTASTRRGCDALSAENEVLRAKLFAYVAPALGCYHKGQGDSPTQYQDRPDLRAKFLGAFDNVIGPKMRFDPVNYGVVVGVDREGGPCTAHDAFSTACLKSSRSCRKHRQVAP